MLRLTALALCIGLPCHAQDFGSSVGDVVPSLSDLTDPFVSAFEYFGEGRPALNISMAPNDENYLEVIIEESGFLDDSVEGQRAIYVVTRTAEGWEVLQAEIQQRCYRGENRDWTSDPCL